MSKVYLVGCDVSHHNLQGEVLQATSASDFCAVKITEGETFKDGKGKDNVQAAVKNGVKLLILYHYCRPDLHQKCESEMNHFIVQANEVIRDYTGYKDVKWALALDWENKSIGNERWLAGAVKVIEDNTGHKPFVYASASVWAGYCKKWDSIMKCPKWVARWSLKEPNVEYDIWQYTNEPWDKNQSKDMKLGEMFTYEPKLTTEDVQGSYHNCHCCCAGKSGDDE